MNRKSLELERMESLKMLDTDTFRPKINAVEINLNNSIEHEIAKFMTVWAIRKGVPADCMIKFFKERHAFEYKEGNLFECLHTHIWSINSFIEKNGQKFKHSWEVPQVVTEARMKDGSIWDILVLDSGLRVEIVESCDKSTHPYDSETVIIKI